MVLYQGKVKTGFLRLLELPNEPAWSLPFKRDNVKEITDATNRAQNLTKQLELWLL